MTYCNIESVQRPYQYVGHEENTYRKPFTDAAVRMCLAFPDAYEVGMSNVGMQILYHVVNEEPDYLCDRVYAPLTDMGDLLRTSGQELLGRESDQPLRAFDCIGFTLQYELCYTNILYMLDLARIPSRAAARGDSDPLIFAGGPCAYNPEPVADFFDFVVIGEGEEVILEVLAAIRMLKVSDVSRQEKLTTLSRIKGVYVPSLYEPSFGIDGRFTELIRKGDAPAWTERRIMANLDQAKYPTRPVTPAIQPVHERVSVEIQRGCTRSCRFCQAGYIYRPRRERRPDTILNIIEKSVEATGISEIGLLSLSSADYSHIHPVMKAVIDRYRDKHLSVSLPSTRLEALEEEYLEVFREEKKSGFTIAPEAGSQRLRNVINKNFTEEEVVETARMLFRNGWQTIKMYFMIGQPTETDEDVIAIAELANTVIRKTADIAGRRNITVSVSNFVPKPHTPFQWHEQISAEEIRRRQKLIRDHIFYKRQIHFRSHSPDSSYVEGLLARSDRRYSHLIEKAYKKGAVFDCWQDKLRVDLWSEAAAELNAETGYDLAREALRGRDFEERLPWHRIYCGIHPRFFKNEYQKAVYGIATEDCSFASCHECGLCNEKSGVAPVILKESVALPVAASSARPSDTPIPEPAVWRFQHEKTGSARFLSAIDLKTMLIKAFKRADISVVYDDGMRQRPKLSMGPALPLGVISSCELFDIQLTSGLEPDALKDRLNRFLPPDLRILTCQKMEKGSPGITAILKSISYRIPAAEWHRWGFDAETLGERVGNFTSAKEVVVTRERKAKDGSMQPSSINVRPTVDSLAVMADDLMFTMGTKDGQPASPFLVLEALLGSEKSGMARRTTIYKSGFHRHA
jgi:radical SAM family uncharacterized protein/radical SAM-linked protein